MTAEPPRVPYLTVIPQRHPKDCAVACLAMLLNVSYEDVLVAFRTNIYRTGANIWQMKAAAKRLGQPLRLTRKVAPGDLENGHGILSVRSALWPLDHVVVLREGTVVDTDATLWDVDVYLAAYKAEPLSLLVLEA